MIAVDFILIGSIILVPPIIGWIVFWRILHPQKYCTICGAKWIEKKTRKGFDPHTGVEIYHYWSECEENPSHMGNPVI